MIVSRPSISTTGPACGLEQAEVGEQVAPAWRLRAARRRSWVRAFSKTSTGVRVVRRSWAESDMPGSLAPVAFRSRAGSVEVRPVQGRRDLNALHQAAVPAPSTGTPWVPPLIFERRAVPRPRTRTRSSSTPRRSTSSPGATASRWAGSPPRSTGASTSSRAATTGMFGFFEAEDDPEVVAALLERRRGLAARPRAASGWSARWTSPPTTSAAC